MQNDIDLPTSGLPHSDGDGSALGARFHGAFEMVKRPDSLPLHFKKDVPGSDPRVLAWTFPNHGHHHEHAAAQRPDLRADGEGLDAFMGFLGLEGMFVLAQHMGQRFLDSDVHGGKGEEPDQE